MPETTNNVFMCNCDTTYYKTKPSGQVIAEIVTRMKNEENIFEMTAEKLSEAVTHGFSITASALNGTNESSFLSQSLLIVDIDNDVDIKKAEKLDEEYKKLKKDEKTLDKAYKILEAHGVEKTPIMSVSDAISILDKNHIDYSFIYYSFSHTDMHPKFRIVCVLNEPILDPSECKRLNQYFISLFPQADQSCHNLDRIYFGTDKGLATKVYDRKTELIIPADWQPEPEKPTKPPISATDKEFKTTKTNTGNKFDLIQAIQEFPLLSYIEETTGMKGEQHGDEVYFRDECPICNHQDDFRLNADKNVYKCFSSSNGSGGNIINYLEQTLNLDRKAAREYFIYEIMGQDRQSQKAAYTAKNASATLNITNTGVTFINPLSNKSRYSLDDKGVGRLFSDTYCNISRFVPESKLWYLYDGKHWKQDIESLKVAEQSKDFTDFLLKCAFNIQDYEQQAKFLKFYSRIASNLGRKIIVDEARSVFPINITDFDKDPYIFNCQNGTLNLRNFTLHEHRADDFLSKISNVVYDPTAKCQRWIEFISEIMQGDMETARFLQKSLGYSLTGDISKECFFILYGSKSRNGKGTTMETTLHLMGDYGRTAQPETIARKQNFNSSAPSEDIARLKGSRFVNMSEPDKGLHLNSALVKQITGGDTITARFLNQNSFEYRPEYKLFINTNHLPRVNDDSIFASGRVKLIPFERHFEENERDEGLKDLFTQPENVSGIFNWFVEGLKLMQAEGLNQPQKVKEAIEQYREESDVVGVFIRECLIKSDDSKVLLKDVYSSYSKWCEENGQGALNNRNLSTELRRKGLKVENGSGNKMCLFGYDLPFDLKGLLDSYNKTSSYNKKKRK